MLHSLGQARFLCCQRAQAQPGGPRRKCSLVGTCLCPSIHRKACMVPALVGWPVIHGGNPELHKGTLHSGEIKEGRLNLHPTAPAKYPSAHQRRSDHRYGEKHTMGRIGGSRPAETAWWSSEGGSSGGGEHLAHHLPALVHAADRAPVSSPHLARQASASELRFVYRYR